MRTLRIVRRPLLLATLLLPALALPAAGGELSFSRLNRSYADLVTEAPPYEAGALVLRSNTIPRWLGVVVAIAGLGYLVDSFGRLLLPSVDLGFVMITFFGEALFMVWLLWHGLRRG